MYIYRLFSVFSGMTIFTASDRNLKLLDQKSSKEISPRQATAPAQANKLIAWVYNLTDIVPPGLPQKENLVILSADRSINLGQNMLSRLL